MWLPTQTLLISTMMLSIMISISSNQWFMMWIGLELNMFAFLPILGKANNKKEISCAPLYLAIQAMSSGLIITSMLLATTSMSLWSDPLFQIAILTKAGGPPAFCWYPNMVLNLSWTNVWILMTLQKINPILILALVTKLNYILLILSASMALIGGMGGMIQNQIRGILAYSSLTHLAWILTLTSLNLMMSLNYLMAYLLIISALLMLLSKSSMKTHTHLANISPQSKTIISLLLLSLAGIPPLLGFLPKLQAINSLIFNSSPMIILILISGSLMNLYFYLNLMLSSSSSYSSLFLLKSPHLMKSTTLFTLALLPLLILIPSTWMTL
uniref:NADH-ubiquinone oxidoreductase chain 2 n=1 Tax=Scoloplos cf. armiger CB-2006 TaxID=375448 RepID=Q19NV6_9ANNE|nr:NADH dehydrogenase subunit 2 [Scoloplos cf. armiger CB-2006]